MPTAKYVSILCPADRPFRTLAVIDPATVAVAVRENESDGAALRWLGYNSDSTRRDQMRDAVAYFGWDTTHWTQPVPADATALRDFSDAVQGETGTHGVEFEARVASTLRSLLAADGGEHEVKPGVYAYESGFTFYDEATVRDFGEDYTPPWDGILVHEQDKTLWAFEVKASMKLARKLRRQLTSRQAWVDSLSAAGYTVKTIAVVSNASNASTRQPGRDWREAGIWFGGLPEFTLAALSF